MINFVIVFQVNGRFVSSYKTRDLSVKIYNKRIIFETRRCGVKVFMEHYGNSLIYLDKNRYGGKVNGVCGTCDGNSKNDWRYVSLHFCAVHVGAAGLQNFALAAYATT